MLEQRARLGETPGFPELGSPTDKQPVDGSRTDVHQLLVDLWTDLEKACIIQPGKFDIRRSSQAFGADTVE